MQVVKSVEWMSFKCHVDIEFYVEKRPHIVHGRVFKNFTYLTPEDDAGFTHLCRYPIRLLANGKRQVVTEEMV